MTGGLLSTPLEGSGESCPHDAAMERASPPHRLAILHIGPMKTGSTSIQVWLRKNARALERQGIRLPLPSLGSNLSPLSLLFEPRRGGEAIPGSGSERVTVEMLAEELTALPPEVHTCVFSGELFGQRMRRPAIERLKEALSPHFDRFRIIIYLRRQDELAVSLYSTVLRRGGRARLWSQPLDYARILDDWCAVFGRDAVRPRLFSRGELIGGDVVTDFLATAELPELDRQKATGERNASLSVAAQALLARLGRRKPGDRRNAMLSLPGHARLVATLNRLHAGSGRMPSRQEAIDYLEQVRETNARVRAEWFPDRDALFGDDFSKYPVEATPEATAEEQLDVAVDVIFQLLADPATRRRGGKLNRKAEKAAAEDIEDEKPQPDA